MQRPDFNTIKIRDAKRRKKHKLNKIKLKGVVKRSKKSKIDKISYIK